jgi:hypothetical protein
MRPPLLCDERLRAVNAAGPARFDFRNVPATFCYHRRDKRGQLIRCTSPVRPDAHYHRGVPDPAGSQSFTPGRLLLKGAQSPP